MLPSLFSSSALSSSSPPKPPAAAALSSAVPPPPLRHRRQLSITRSCALAAHGRTAVVVTFNPYDTDTAHSNSPLLLTSLHLTPASSLSHIPSPLSPLHASSPVLTLPTHPDDRHGFRSVSIAALHEADVCAASSYHAVQFWNLATQRALLRHPCPHLPIQHHALSPNASTLFIAATKDNKSSLSLIDVTTASTIATLVPPSTPVAVALRAPSHTLALHHDLTALHAHDLRSRAPRPTFSLHPPSPRRLIAVDADRTAHTILTIHDNPGELCVWDARLLADPVLMRPSHFPFSHLATLSLTPDGSRLVVSGSRFPLNSSDLAPPTRRAHKQRFSRPVQTLHPIDSAPSPLEHAAVPSLPVEDYAQLQRYDAHILPPLSSRDALRRASADFFRSAQTQLFTSSAKEPRTFGPKELPHTQSSTSTKRTSRGVQRLREKLRAVHLVDKGAQDKNMQTLPSAVLRTSDFQVLYALEAKGHPVLDNAISADGTVVATLTMSQRVSIFRTPSNDSGTTSTQLDDAYDAGRLWLGSEVVYLVRDFVQTGCEARMCDMIEVLAIPGGSGGVRSVADAFAAHSLVSQAVRSGVLGLERTICCESLPRFMYEYVYQRVSAAVRIFGGSAVALLILRGALDAGMLSQTHYDALRVAAGLCGHVATSSELVQRAADELCGDVLPQLYGEAWERRLMRAADVPAGRRMLGQWARAVVGPQMSLAIAVAMPMCGAFAITLSIQEVLEILTGSSGSEDMRMPELPTSVTIALSAVLEETFGGTVSVVEEEALLVAIAYSKSFFDFAERFEVVGVREGLLRMAGMEASEVMRMVRELWGVGGDDGGGDVVLGLGDGMDTHLGKFSTAGDRATAA